MRRGLVLLGLSLVGCAGAPRRPQGLLVLHAAPADARVLLDDRYIGTAGQLSGRPLRLGAGVRRVEVSAEGRYAARREADVRQGGTTELRIELTPIPDGERDTP